MGAILGDSFLADSARKFSEEWGEPPFVWVLDHPVLEERHYARDDLVVISTPLPLGTTARLEGEFPNTTFAYLPENVRQAHAVEDWFAQKRHLLGCRDRDAVKTIAEWAHPIPVIVMSPEEAELAKHAINGFFAMSIRYAHQIADIANRHGLDPMRVAAGVMSDPRIGERAYLKPGGDVGPNLQREVDRLRSLGAYL